MAVFGKILKVFKKGKKHIPQEKGQPAKGGIEWPAGTRLGVFGHANSGKTVYFTVLNEESKIARDLQISVTDNITAGEFLKHYREIWGLGTTSDVGTAVDTRGEKTFPEPTQVDKLLQFNAILDGKKKVSVVAYDYPGVAVDIEERSEIAAKVTDFFVNCDGILFFFDPKNLGAELVTQSHVAAFVNMLERLAPLHKRLPIPVALVITKADILDGFVGEDQAILLKPEQEHLLSENFELFLEAILADNRIAANSAWAGTVRNILVKLREFLKVVVGRTLDFQVFFTSNTGFEPEKIGTDIGRSIYKPPEKISPVGVKEPVYWILSSILRNRKISGLRKVAKYAAVLSIVWILIFSIPFAFHFGYLLPKARSVEDNITSEYDGNVVNTSAKERNRIKDAYNSYQHAWTVKWFFPRFSVPAERLREFYQGFNLADAEQQLDHTISRFAAIVQDSTLWPKLNPSDQTILENEEHQQLVNDLTAFHQGDSTSELYQRAGRVLTYWDLFKNYIANRADTTALTSITEQVQFDNRTYPSEISKAEKELGDALQSSLTTRTEKKVQKEVAKKAGVEFTEVVKRINGNDSPAYRLGDAVTELKRLRSQLDPTADAEAIRAIDRYIREADRFDNRHQYTFKIVSVPGNGHLHVEVTSRGQDPKWNDQSQLLQGFEYPLEWKVGDQIHLALDTLGAPENWGRTASDKKVLTGRYSLFDMDGEITFDNVGKTVTLQFSPGLKDRLPKLED